MSDSILYDPSVVSGFKAMRYESEEPSVLAATRQDAIRNSTLIGQPHVPPNQDFPFGLARTTEGT